MNQKQQIGAAGEAIATRYLQSIGYKLYKKNVRLHRDEIDIIAYDPEDKVVVFAEVKTRSTHHPEYQPELGLTFSKKKYLFRSARKWVARKAYDKGYRVDLVCITGTEVTSHIKEINAAQPQ